MAAHLQPHLDVGDLPERPLPDQVLDREHVRAEAKLEVDRRGQPAVLAGLQDRARGIETLTHRLLNEDGRALG